MPRPTASIQAEINALEAELQSVDPQSQAADGASRTEVDRQKLQQRLDELYALLDRRSVGMFTRGKITGQAVG